MTVDNLENRLTKFLGSTPGAESIDALTIPALHKEARRADFLLDSRKVIVEIKSLYIDPSPKVDATVEMHRPRPEFPIFYGSVDVTKVLSHLPDGELIQSEIAQKLTRSIEGAYKSADEQIASTKSIFGLSDAGGLLIIANQAVEILSPELIVWQLSKMASKKSGSGEARYPNVQLIWLVSETHTLVRRDVSSNTLLPSFIIETLSTGNSDVVSVALNNLQPAWAKFNGWPFIEIGDVSVDLQSLTPTSTVSETVETAVPRHEFWRRAYRKEPYLRSLPKEELLSFGANALKQLEPFFVLEPGAATPRRSVANESEALDALMQPWTHFLEEMQFRGIDMRDLAKHQGRLK